MVRDILIWPDPRLKKKASAVKRVSPTHRALITDLFDTMYAAHGVGLAAPQVGVLERVLVVDTRAAQPDVPALALVNPELLSLEGELVYPEGCLSLPGETEDVPRAARVTVRYLDEDGQVQTRTCEGLLAVAIQHELDHLNGTLIVDHISILKRELIRKRMKKLKLERSARPSASPA